MSCTCSPPLVHNMFARLSREVCAFPTRCSPCAPPRHTECGRRYQHSFALASEEAIAPRLCGHNGPSDEARSEKLSSERYVLSRPVPLSRDYRGFSIRRALSISPQRLLTTGELYLTTVELYLSTVELVGRQALSLRAHEFNVRRLRGDFAPSLRCAAVL